MKKLVAIVAFFAAFAITPTATAIPTGCSAYGYNNMNGRGVVQSYCSGGTGHHRAVGVFKVGLVLRTYRSPYWSPVGATSYVVGPPGSIVWVASYERG